MKWSIFKDTNVDSELEKYAVKDEEIPAENELKEEKPEAAAEAPKPVEEPAHENQVSAIAALTGQREAEIQAVAEDKTIEYKATFNLDEEEEVERKEKTVISEPTEEFDIDEDEDEEDEDYEYVTPHYFRNAFLITVLFVLIGMAASFFLFRGQMEIQLRAGYIANGYIMTNDATASAADIREGKTAYVHGKLVQGTYIDIDTSNATATPADILEGYTAYVNGKLITGTIPTYEHLDAFIPGTEDIIIPRGVYLKNTLRISGSSQLQAKNIRAGIEIFGVVGSYTGK